MENELKEEFTRIEFPVFDYVIKVLLTNNLKESREKLSGILGALEDEISESVDGMHSYNKRSNFCYIIIDDKATLGTLAHECSHAVRRMFKYFDAKMANEHFEYHLGYVVDEIEKFKKELNGKSLGGKQKRKRNLATNSGRRNNRV